MVTEKVQGTPCAISTLEIGTSIMYLYICDYTESFEFNGEGATETRLDSVIQSYILLKIMKPMYKQEEPCERRLSSTVTWEREGEIPLRDSIAGNALLRNP